MGERSVPVRTYTKKDGTAVVGHDRKLPATTSERQPSTTGLRGVPVDDSHLYRDVAGQRIPLVDSGLPAVYLKFTDVPSGADLSGLNLAGADFSNTGLVGVSFAGSNLTGANFYAAFMRDVDLRGTTTTGASFKGTRGERLSADTLDLQDVDLYHATLSFDRNAPPPKVLNFSVAERHTASKIIWADLSHADLSGMGSRCDNVKLWYVNLSNADLQGVEMSRWELSGCDLSNADLTDARITMTSFWENVTAHGARFDRAIFDDVSFVAFDAADATFREAQLSRVHMLHGSLIRSDFTAATFKERFAVEHCDFRGVNFTDADLGATRFAFGPSNDPTCDTTHTTDLTGCTWVGAKTDHMKLSQHGSRPTESPTDWSLEEVWQVTQYERYSIDEAVDLLGVDRETLAVLAWGGAIDVRDNETCQNAEQSGDLDNCHIPIWVIQNGI